MTTGKSRVVFKKSWRADTRVKRAAPWGFLGNREGLYLYHLGRDYYRGDGVVVDAGSFLGRSAWFLGTGLAENPTVEPVAQRVVHCFDNFIVNDRFTAESIRKKFHQELELGASTRHLFDEATISVAGWLNVHHGDFHTASWPDGKIEILFVDITKTASLNARLIELMFPNLIPERSVVVQQDYHHPWLPHVHTSMEYLNAYFDLVEPKVDDSAVFLLRRAIPPDVLHVAAHVHELPFDEQLALMERAVKRLPESYRRHVELARAHLIGQAQGPDAMSRAMDEIDAKYGTEPDDAMWQQYHGQMRSVVLDLRNGLTRGWQLVADGAFQEALRIAETFSPSDERYWRAAALRANALRRLGRTAEARTVLDGALATRPADAALWAETAWLELDLGDNEAAVRAARRGLTSSNQSPEYLDLCRAVLGKAESALADQAAAIGVDK